MHPNPMADTSRLPPPRLRFCIVITPLLHWPNQVEIAFGGFAALYPFPRYGMLGYLCFPDTADSLPNPA